MATVMPGNLIFHGHRKAHDREDGSLFGIFTVNTDKCLRDKLFYLYKYQNSFQFYTQTMLTHFCNITIVKLSLNSILKYKY